MKFRGGSLTALLKAGERCQGWDTRCKKTEELQQSCVWRLNAAIWSLDWTWELLFSIQERGEKLVAGGLQTLQIHYGFWIEWVIVVSYGPRLSAGLCCNITTDTKHKYGKPYFLVYRHFDVCLPLDDVFEILMSIDGWFLRVKSPITTV